jgi:hypothetical protein
MPDLCESTDRIFDTPCGPTLLTGLPVVGGYKAWVTCKKIIRGEEWMFRPLACCLYLHSLLLIELYGQRSNIDSLVEVDHSYSTV